MKHVTVYTDGSCSPNPGVGSWAAIIDVDGFRIQLRGRSDEVTTNNRMEMTAAIKALVALVECCDVDLYTDSTYLKRGATEWLDIWHGKGFKCHGQEIKNADLWRQIWVLERKHDVNWKWIRGHQRWEHPENCQCDRMAKEERKAITA